jgi:hypothetical protein
MLPADLRSYVNEVRQRCKELDSASQPHEVMQGIWPLDLDGNGSHDFMVDAQQLCNGWLKGGNCTNRGCDLKIWKKVDQRVWRKIFDEHLYAKFISASSQRGLDF